MLIKTFNRFCDNHAYLYEEILDLTSSVSQIYPDYSNWYKDIFIPGLKKKERLYIIAVDEKKKTLAGCVLLKRTKSEKKICTVFVHPQYRNRGIATQLMKQSLVELGKSPLITVSSQKLSQFRSILNRFQFRLSAIKEDPKNPFKAELYFNDTNASQRGLFSALKERTR